MNRSTIECTAVSDWPTPTVSMKITSKPAASHNTIVSRVLRATPPREPAAGGLHRPLGHLDADAVLARLKDDGRVVDLHDLTDHTADGGDAVALFQAAAHLLRLLFALVFRTNDEEIEDRDHRDHEKKGFHNC